MHRYASRGVLFVIALALGLITVFPILWMLSSSLKTRRDQYDFRLWPENPTLDNFRYVFSSLPFERYMLNSFVVSVTVTVVALFFHSMAGYALARLRFPGRETLFLLIFSTLLVSLPVILVPLFI
ncbi:MAG TPA: hypothetical protein VM450_17790, partial [Thermomicrobiales bacterium]|nr:hypothetical protein [Thermomicrobiales bacterium]